MSGLIVWHFYRNGIIVNSLAEDFEGSVEQFKQKIDSNFVEMKDCERIETIRIFHGFIGE